MEEILKATEQYFPMVQILLLYKVSGGKSYRVNIQMKVTG